MDVSADCSSSVPPRHQEVHNDRCSLTSCRKGCDLRPRKASDQIVTLACSVEGSSPCRTTQEQFAFVVFARLFREYGLPVGVRTDNGVPFASPHALYGLSKLAVWWLRLGKHIERIRPGHPEQNGRHERTHRTLKREATKPAAPNFLQQQARFDTFVHRYNHERPHQALGMDVPAEHYRPSPRPYRGLTGLHIPGMIGRRRSRGAAAFAETTARSISAPCLPARRWASGRSRTAFGSWPSCTTISDILMMKRVGSSRLPIRSASKCYRCLRAEQCYLCPGKFNLQRRGNQPLLNRTRFFGETLQTNFTSTATNWHSAHISCACFVPAARPRGFERSDRAVSVIPPAAHRLDPRSQRAGPVASWRRRR